MSATEGTLAKVSMAYRIGATVLHEGRAWAVWGYGAGVVWLWSDASGEAELVEVAEMVAGRLPVVSVARIYLPEAKRCTRRGHPDAAPDAGQCPTCGLSILERAS